MVVQTTVGVHTIEKRYLRAAENFAVSRRTLFRQVVIPAVLPQIIVGMRIYADLGWDPWGCANNALHWPNRT